MKKESIENEELQSNKILLDVDIVVVENASFFEEFLQQLIDQWLDQFPRSIIFIC